MFATLFPWIQSILAILLVGAILLQKSEGSLGAAFGQSSSSIYTKRGSEKYLFIATIVFGVLFVIVALARFLLV